MFERLKSLPLTIVLTILIWMYAESQVNSTQTVAQTTIRNIPVWVSGPPEMLARYDVKLYPATVDIVISGTPDQIVSLRDRTHLPPGVYAYLDIAYDDRPGSTLMYRPVRFVLPTGVNVVSASSVAFTLADTSHPGKP